MCSSKIDRVGNDEISPSSGGDGDSDVLAEYEEVGVPQPNERLSEAFPDEFAAYCEHFVNYFPTSPYFVRTTYDENSPYGGWPQKKSKKARRPLALIDNDSWLNKTDCVERHLDYEQWLLFKQTTEPNEGHERLGDFYWLGLSPPKMTTFHSIDLDNKRILGYYDEPVLPVVHMPLDHFRAMKRVYHAFPNRIWCITSETLGLDIIERHTLMNSATIHDKVKRRLSRIGLGSTEVHPMSGRCKRRPFGFHYRTISKDGVLDTWQEQLAYYLNPGPTPEFEHICQTLLACLREQWRCLQCHVAAHKGSRDLQAVVDEHAHKNGDVENWLSDGCPMEEPVQVAVATNLHVEQPPTPSRQKRAAKKAVGDFTLQELRNGNWIKGLERIARYGLSADDSVGQVAHEMAKFLWWIELYDVPEPERERQTFELLCQLVRTKHNGYITRWNDGHHDLIFAQLRRCLESARALDEDHRPESLEIFALIRQKRQQGRYRRVINLQPLITGCPPDFGDVDDAASCLETLEEMGSCPQQVEEVEAVTSSPSHSSPLSSPSISFSVGGLADLDTPLPQTIVSLIDRHCGRSRPHQYATRLLNHIFKTTGVCRLSHKALTDMLGYQDRKRTTQYNKILIKAGLLAKDHYVRGRRTCGYWLTKEARQLFEEEKQKDMGVA